MAQNATIFKVTLEIADIDRAYYKGRPNVWRARRWYRRPPRRAQRARARSAVAAAPGPASDVRPP